MDKLALEPAAGSDRHELEWPETITTIPPLS
jgi:hypothetical protein